MALFNELYKVALTWSLQMKPYVRPLKWKLLKSAFRVVLFIELYKVVLTLGLDETLMCDHSNESYWKVLSCGSAYWAVQGGFNFRLWMKP